MKKLILLFIISSIYAIGFAQKPTCTIDNHFFLLGTLSEYMGYQTYKKVDNRVDVYWENGYSFAKFISEMFKDDYPDLELRKNKLNGRPEIYSTTLSKKVKSYFNFEYSKGGAYNGDVDFKELNLDSLTKTKDFYTLYFDSVFYGNLKPNIFKTEHEEMSFLAGVYYRYGAKKDSIYTIKIANSTSKAAVCVSLLKEMKLENFKHESFNGIPGVDKIYFTPNKHLKEYLEVY